MKIGFIGDIHGRIFHAISAILMWQAKNSLKLDMIIQVGDFGAFPNPDESMLNNKFILQDPTELDFKKFLYADADLLNYQQRVKKQLNSPIYFIRGNHEDFQWLNQISKDGTQIVAIDKLDIVSYIPDGSIIDFNGIRLAFLSGIDSKEEEQRAINRTAYKRLLATGPGEIDILVTHDSPYGTGISFTGEVQGSKKISELIEAIQPKYLISGHYHHKIGPIFFKKTEYLGLDILIPPRRRDSLGCVQSGSIAILDTDNTTIKFINDEWITQIDRNFDFKRFIRQLENDITE